MEYSTRLIIRPFLWDASDAAANDRALMLELTYSAPQFKGEGLEMLDANRCFMRFSDRAERVDSQQIAETFVSVGPLLDTLESTNNQIIYGRRGTGTGPFPSLY
jgi:hypothetical protein